MLSNDTIFIGGVRSGKLMWRLREIRVGKVTLDRGIFYIVIIVVLETTVTIFSEQLEELLQLCCCPSDQESILFHLS
jgi:hypothetical protein